MSEKMINVAHDFYPRPVGRFYSDGDFSGQKFRVERLVPAIRELNANEKLTIDFTGVTMAGSSFLEEAFGGLVRIENFDKSILLKQLNIISPRKVIIERIIEYIKEARSS